LLKKKKFSNYILEFDNDDFVEGMGWSLSFSLTGVFNCWLSSFELLEFTDEWNCFSKNSFNNRGRSVCVYIQYIIERIKNIIIHNLIVLYKKTINEQITIHVKISSIGIEYKQQIQQISCEWQ